MTRRRWLYTMGGRPLETPVEVGEEYAPVDVRQPVYTDRYMEGTRATDGTDISSRSKRNEWMKRNDFVDVSDCTGMWAKAAKERQAMAEGRHDTIARRDDIGRAIHELSRRK